MQELLEQLIEMNLFETTAGDVVKIGLEGLAAEAKKYDTFEDFERAWLSQLKHGLYWHVTYDSDFQISLEKGPRDMSSMASGRMVKGALMITSHLEYWVAEYSVDEIRGKSREYAAIIDMSDVPKNEYYQVKRGFGNEFYVKDASKAKVLVTLPIKKALKFDGAFQEALPGSEEELRVFYEQHHG